MPEKKQGYNEIALINSMTANAKDLTVIADVKTLLNISVTTWDTLLQTLVTAASKFIANYCDRDFCDAGTDVTEYYDGYDGNLKTLQLKKYPIVSITSLGSRIGSFTNPTYYTYDPATQYTFKPETGEVFLLFPLPRGHQNIKAIYRGGYAVGSFPEDLALACGKLVGKEYLKRQSQGVINESIGGASIAWHEDLDPTVEHLLASYKNVSI